METYEFVQLALLAVGGEIKGKTRLQKTVYFLGVLTHCLDSLGYRPHFYGPYSEEVADAVNRLRVIGLVDQSPVGGGAKDESGFEVRRYDFRLSAEGKRLAEAKAQDNPEVWEKLSGVMSTFQKAGQPDYMLLSVAAKTYFMLGEKKGCATDTELTRLAPKFGWTVTEKQIRAAAEYLNRLDLVQLSPN